MNKHHEPQQQTTIRKSVSKACDIDCIFEVDFWHENIKPVKRVPKK
jgi:hypothetical protein